MTMVIRVPNVSWSGKGFPNISPFVSIADLDFAFDFANRSNRLQDVAGKHADLVPYRQDIAGGVTRTIDPTIVVDEANGLGIRVELGYLQTDVALANIPLDGSVQFTIMVAGGYSGVAFPSNKVAGVAPGFSSMIDFGTGIGASGFSIEDYVSGGTGTAATRIKSAPPVMSDTITPGSKKSVVFLTFNGTTWSFVNKTLGTSYSKTNTDLGISGSLGFSAAHVSKVVMGHYHSSSTLGALYPTLYQTAKWNRVLTAAEINEQYARTQANKPGIGL